MLVNHFLLALVLLALLTIELLGAGTRLVFAIPTYALISAAGFLAVVGARQGSIKTAKVSCLLTTSAFFAYVLTRSALSPVAFLARRDLYMMIAAIIVYLLFITRLNSSKQRSIFAAFLLLLTFAQTVVGAIQFAAGSNFMILPFLPRSDQYGSRASGFYTTPNHLAGFFEITVFIALAFCFFSRWKMWGKISTGYVALVGMAGIIMTGSRGGYLSFFGGLLVFGFLCLLIIVRQHKERIVFILGALGLLAAAVTIAVLFAVNQSDLISSRLKLLIATDVREDFARAAIEQFKTSPFVGTGCGTYLYYGRTFRAKGANRDPIYAHNDYLQFLGEFGAIGIALLIPFLGAHLLSGWSSFQELSSLRHEDGFTGSNSLALTIAALSALTAYMIHSALDFNLHIPGNALLMAAIFGLLASPSGPLRNRGRGSKRPITNILPITTPAFGLWLGLASIPRFPGEYFYEKSSTALSAFNPATESFEYGDAKKFAEMSLQYEKDNPDTYYCLGESLVGLSETISSQEEKRRLYQKALAAYNSGLQLFPDDIRLVLCKGWALDFLEDYDEAENVFRHAVAIDPNSGPVRVAYAQHLYKMGKLDESEAQYKAAFERASYTAAEFGLQQIAKDRKTKDATQSSAAEKR